MSTITHYCSCQPLNPMEISGAEVESVIEEVVVYDVGHVMDIGWHATEVKLGGLRLQA